MAKSDGSYHHGELKSAALAEAVLLLEAEGAGSISMRTLAKRIGVTHRALYRWFSDRDALLAEVAAIGFVKLAESILRASPSISHDRDSFVRGYLEFSLAHPAIYDVAMSQNRAAIRRSPALEQAVQNLVAISIAAFDASGDEGRDAIMALWSLLHGLVSLYRAGLLAIGDDGALVAYGQRLARQVDFPADPSV